jgi:2-polyprenyl-6-methoxyphenol hydroxylase-like FAD-dependent oxidoreductase
MDKLKVIVIGAGTGGLCLAHGLRAAGVNVRVFERDHKPTDRTQGYRLTINTNGARALRSCLPRANFERYITSSAKISTAVTFFDHRLRRLMGFDLPRTDQSDPDAPRPISRVALRQILLEGLEEAVEFEKTFTAFETSADGRVVAHFDDGTVAEGDVLIGADGASSRVRRQRLPHAERIDTGIVAVSGKLPLDLPARRETPPAVFKGPTLILGPRGGFMFAGAVEYPPEHSSLYDPSEYVMWGFSIRRESLDLDAAEQVPGEVARAAVLAQVPDWSPEIRRLVERAESSSLTTFAIKSSVPIPPWATNRITLLGDALHNMTPFRGIGANTALRHAALLCEALRNVDAGRQDLVSALAAYEQEMIRYGFAAVRASLAQMKNLHTRSSIRRFATKTVFRLVDSSPMLRRRAMQAASG